MEQHQRTDTNDWRQGENYAIKAGDLAGMALRHGMDREEIIRYVEQSLDWERDELEAEGEAAE